MKRVCLFFLFLSAMVLWTRAADAQEPHSIVSKYDFIPGEKVIYYDDFTAENVGDFPAQWLTNGSGEIVTSSKFPGRWFQITKAGYYIPDLGEDCTDNFTVEFDIVPMNNLNNETMTCIDFLLLSGDRKTPGYGGQPGQAGMRLHPDYDNVIWNNWSEAREWQGDNGSVAYTFKATEKYHIAIWVQKLRVRMYSNESKILDLPRGLQANYKYNIFRIETLDGGTPLIANFRIAAGLPDMRNKLLKDGKIISYGIQFDVNSDVVRPESYSTLKEIAGILKDNPSVKITIVGHTDSDGDDAFNLDLSKRRSASVKKELTDIFGIDASRLEIDGKGESAPLAPNDSAINKAKNRRVEFVKL